MNSSFNTNRQLGPMFPFAYKFPQSFESTHQFSTTVPFRSYAPRIHHETYSQSALARNLSPQSVPKKKNSFTIEAILGIDSSESDQVVIRDEEMCEKRTNRLCSYPFPTVTGDTHINDNEMKRCLNYEEKPTKSKRVRTIFTSEQLERLESEFERQQYMVGPERLFLASTLCLKEAQVKVWFQNRRIKWRKDNHEMQQARLAELRSDGDEQQLD